MSLAFVKNIFKGVIIGIANIIPGVSGGTLAISMGIYDKIIYAVNHLFKELKQSLKTLFPYAIGMIIGILGLSFSIECLFRNYPFQTSILFIGLIVGCVPLTYKNVKEDPIKIRYVIGFLLMFLLVAGTSIIGSGSGNTVILKTDIQSIIKLFFVGIIASATMIIPGVSGSMILTIMGYYLSIIEEINSCLKYLFAGNINAMVHSVIILIPFGIGVILGIFIISKIVEIVFEKAKVFTYWCILGLVLASPIAILMVSDNVKPSPSGSLIGVAALFAGILVSKELAD